MPVWRCPHCATPQPEASRCWVCRRSTTSCATCRHYRRGVAGGLGLCGLDPRHRALRGTEMLPCWVAAPPAPEPGSRGPVAVGPGRRHGGDAILGDEGTRAARTFVPVEPSGQGTGADRETRQHDPVAPEPAGRTTDAAVAQAARISPATGGTRVPGTWWLWGDPEPWPDL